MSTAPLFCARPSKQTLEIVIAALTQRFGSRAATGEAIRAQHGHTRSYLETQAPDIVVWPDTTEEVAEIVTLCAQYAVPLIPFGTGTSLEGHVNAPLGGVCVDLSHMNQILAIHADDLDCVVGPGVTRKLLNETLRDQGLFFPIDPGADASIGGMASTRASGTNAVRYGTMKDNILALTVVMPDGSIIKTGTRARKSSAGYDLTRLFIGAEGTLGIITEITLKLYGIPEAISGGICSFPSVKAACDAVIMTIQSGIPVARIELADAVQVRCFNLYSKLGLPETPMLFLEFHGSEAGVKEQAERFGEIVEEFGGGPFQWTAKPEERTKLWQARHDAYWASFTLRPGAQSVSTDVCVPISRLAECVEETQKDIAETGIPAPIVGHVGDGNFHIGLMFFPDDPQEMAKIKPFLQRLVKRALAMEGTCSGEHGIGQQKRDYMGLEHSVGALNIMRGIKRQMDPKGIMNPGKMFPED
jgi:D-lactate dehydrogenase (cytochrome)